MRLYLSRILQDDFATHGFLNVLDDDNNLVFTCLTLEQAWRNNQKSNSCIPKGWYPIVYEWSPKFNKKLWEIKSVYNRSECKFHVANYVNQLEGCIALGTALKDINLDNILDVINSTETLEKLHSILDKKTSHLLIIN